MVRLIVDYLPLFPLRFVGEGGLWGAGAEIGKPNGFLPCPANPTANHDRQPKTKTDDSLHVILPFLPCVGTLTVALHIGEANVMHWPIAGGYRTGPFGWVL